MLVRFNLEILYLVQLIMCTYDELSSYVCVHAFICKTVSYYLLFALAEQLLSFNFTASKIKSLFHLQHVRAQPSS